jgi:hypothetical protein
MLRLAVAIVALLILALAPFVYLGCSGWDA